MVLLQNRPVDIKHFPDGALLLKETVQDAPKDNEILIKWNYENNEELLAVYFITEHIKSQGYENIVLEMPYIPNARQDRVKNKEDVFTLKYFAKLINSLGYREVRVLDAHSSVSTALIDRVKNISPADYIERVIRNIEQKTKSTPLMFYPDEGAGKRYSGMITAPYCFGIKKRDWETGEIKGLDVAGQTELIKGKDILMVDDICSYGGTFLFSAERLREMGAKSIYIFVSHCENSVLNGRLLSSGLITKIFTTDSIFSKEHGLIEVM